MTEKRNDLGDLLYVVLKRRKFLIWNTVIVTLLVLGITFLLPPRYRATATLLPPQQDTKELLGLGGILQNFDLSKVNMSGITTSSQIYLAILKSRTVADSLLAEFNLKERYKAKTDESARRALRAYSNFRLGNTGLLHVSVEDKDPQTAADMANAYVDHLDRVNREIHMTEGKRTRIFVRGRLDDTKVRLRAAEDSLLAFKESHPGVVLPDNATSSADAAASLMSQRISVGAELDVLRSSLSPKAPALARKEKEVKALDRQLNDLPALEMELGRRYRDFKVQEKVFELLTSQYEEASIQENRDVSTVEVLDRAIPPIRKCYPRRGLTSGIAFVISLAAGLLLVVSLEALGRMHLDEDARIRSAVRRGSLLDRILFGSRSGGSA